MSEGSKGFESDEGPGDENLGSPTWLALIAAASLLLLLAVSGLGLKAAFAPSLSGSRTLGPDTALGSEPGTTQAIGATPEAVEHPGLAEPAPTQACEVAVVAETGSYEVAQVRQTPGGTQVSWIPRGETIQVCDLSETPGTNIASQWRRISGGSHDGGWIAERVLSFPNR